MSRSNRFGLESLKAGQSTIIPSGDDPMQTMGYIGRSIKYYKTRGAVFTMQPVSEGYKVTCIVPAPAPKNTDPKHIRENMRKLRAKRGGQSTAERAFWRAAYLAAYSRLPTPRGADIHGMCREFADGALEDYRTFVVRHEKTGPVDSSEGEE